MNSSLSTFAISDIEFVEDKSMDKKEWIECRRSSNVHSIVSSLSLLDVIDENGFLSCSSNTSDTYDNGSEIASETRATVTLHHSNSQQNTMTGDSPNSANSGSNDYYDYNETKSITLSPQSSITDMNETVNENDNDNNNENESNNNEINNNNISNNNSIILNSLDSIVHKFDVLFPFYRLSDKDCKHLCYIIFDEIELIDKVFCDSVARLLVVKIYNYGSDIPRKFFFYNKEDSSEEVSKWKDIKMSDQYCLKELGYPHLTKHERSNTKPFDLNYYSDNNNNNNNNPFENTKHFKTLSCQI